MNSIEVIEKKKRQREWVKVREEFLLNKVEKQKDKVKI